jgi:hypothetical protein
VAQGQRLVGGHAHALPVDRVEAARRVPEYGQSLGEPGQALVVASHRVREPVPHHLAYRCGRAQGVVDLGGRQAGRVVDEGLRGDRRVVAGVTHERDQPPSVGHPAHAAAAAPAGRRPDDDAVIGSEDVPGNVEPARGIPEVDADAFLGRLGITGVQQPPRGSRAAAGRVHHQVREQGGLRCRRIAISHADPAHRTGVWGEHEPRGCTGIPDLDAGEGRHPSPDFVLQVWPGQHQAGQVRPRAVEPVAVEVPAGVRQHVARRHALRDQVLAHAGEEAVEHLGTARQQRVDVRALGNAAAGIGRGRPERVPLHDGHVVVELPQDQRREEPAESRADDDRPRCHRRAGLTVSGLGRGTDRGRRAGEGPP